MKTVNEFRNELLKRKEILFSLESHSNPGFEVSKKAIVEKLKVEPEKIAMKSVKNNFGAREFLIEAFVYDTKEDKERIEPKVKLKKTEVGK